MICHRYKVFGGRLSLRVATCTTSFIWNVPIRQNRRDWSCGGPAGEGMTDNGHWILDDKNLKLIVNAFNKYISSHKVYISSIFKRFLASTASRQAVQCSGLLMMQERGPSCDMDQTQSLTWELLQLPDLCACTYPEGVGCRVCEFHLSKPYNKCRSRLKCAEWKETGQRAAEETATGMERKKMDHTESRSFWDQENWLCGEHHTSAYGASVSWEREKQKQGICNYQAVKLLRTSRVLGVHAAHL